MYAVGIFHIIYKHVIGLYLLGRVPFWGSFWIRVVLSLVIHSGIFVAYKNLHKSESAMDGGKPFKPAYKYIIIAWLFQITYFFSAALSDSSCMSTS